jgi:hypothetical protein
MKRCSATRRMAWCDTPKGAIGANVNLGFPGQLD